jgi:hypothetical protein
MGLLVVSSPSVLAPAALCLGLAAAPARRSSTLAAWTLASALRSGRTCTWACAAPTERSWRCASAGASWGATRSLEPEKGAAPALEETAAAGSIPKGVA